MPTYEYECTACGHRFDELQSFSEAALTKCPKCKKNKLQRLFGGGGAIIFKGGGFYETDYRRAGEKADKGEAPAETLKPETKAETKSDTKPDSTPAPAPAPAPAAASDPKPAAKSEGKGGGKKAK
jgi:putative FmdB family regulatory protein